MTWGVPLLIAYHFAFSYYSRQATASRLTKRRQLPAGSQSAAERSYPASEVSGGGCEELPCVRGQGRWLGGDTLSPRSGAVAERNFLASEVSGGGCKVLPQV